MFPHSSQLHLPYGLPHFLQILSLFDIGLPNLPSLVFTLPPFDFLSLGASSFGLLMLVFSLLAFGRSSKYFSASIVNGFPPTPHCGQSLPSLILATLPIIWRCLAISLRILSVASTVSISCLSGFQLSMMTFFCGSFASLSEAIFRSNCLSAFA